MPGLLDRLLRRATPPRPPASFAPPAPERPLWVIGDLHGCAAALEALLAKIAEEAPEAHIVTVGDYIDRGEESAAVLRRVQPLAEAGQITCLRGNHEEMMLGWLDGEETGWLRHGGLQTLASFGLGAGLSAGGGQPDDLARARTDLRHRLVEAGLLGWLSALPRFWRSGNCVITHAGADPARPPEVQSNALTWGHPEFLRRPRGDGLWIIHGHWVQSRAEIDAGLAAGRIGTDTGAYAGSGLTAVLLQPGQAPRFVSVLS